MNIYLTKNHGLFFLEFSMIGEVTIYISIAEKEYDKIFNLYHVNKNNELRIKIN